MITPPSMRFIKKLPDRWRLNWLQAVCSMILPGVCVVALAGCTPTGPRALLEGKRQLEARQYSKAIEKLKIATSLLPTNAQAWNYLGVASHYAGQAAEAEQAYQRALALNHDLFEARYNLGCLLLEQNKTNAAKNELTAFTLRRANSIEGLLKLGVAQLRCREFLAAEKSFNEVVRLNPNSAQALNGLGLARLGRTRAGEAAQFFNRALKEQPSFRPALLNLAIVAQQHLKNAPLALQKYREYLALKPAPENAEAVRKVVLQLEQELSPPPRASLTNSAPVVRTNASLAKHHASLAAPPPSPRTDTGAVTKTIASPPPAAQGPPAALVQPQAVEVVNLKEEPVLQPVKDLPPGIPEPEPEAPPPAPPIPIVASTATPPEKPVETKAAPKKGFFERLNVFRSSEKAPLQPTPLPDSEAQTDSAQRTNASGRYRYLSPFKPQPGNRPEAEGMLAQGVRAQEAGSLPEAIKAYQKAAELDPSFFEAHYNLGLALTESGALSTALTAYERALAIRPDSLDARYNLALVLKRANYIADAVSQLEQVLSRSPSEVRAHLALGNIYAQQLQQPSKARQHYMKVLELDSRHAEANAIRYWLAANP